MFGRLKRVTVVLMLVSIAVFPPLSHGEDAIEYAGIGVGLTAGNMLFLPIKAIAVGAGLFSGALSFVLTGNADLTKQIWHDTTEPPYVITPEVARMAVGQRPELAEKK
jgi:hypothetical protein